MQFMLVCTPNGACFYVHVAAGFTKIDHVTYQLHPPYSGLPFLPQDIKRQLMDITVQWLMEIRRSLKCVGWRLLAASRTESEEPFADAVGEQVRDPSASEINRNRINMPHPSSE